MEYLRLGRTGTLFRAKDDIIWALNIIIGHYPRSSPHILSIGSNKHFELSAKRTPLNLGLLAVRGLFVSTYAVRCGLLVNVHTTYTVWYQEGPFSQLMVAYLNDHGSDIQKLEAFLKSL
jgi:hypothetical protein